MEKMMNMEKNTQVIGMNDEHKTYTDMHDWNTHRLSNGLVKSQKAIALWHHQDFGKGYSGYRSPKTLYVLVDDDPWEVVKWAETSVSVNTDIFVRTCPLNPRHGVLESTRCVNHKNAIVKTVQHLQAVMLEHDPEGCLIVQAYQPASASCVLAPNMYVVFGEGHDGVTAGTNYSDAGTSLRFPLRQSESVFTSALDNMSKHAGYDYDVNKHEIEMVFTDEWDKIEVEMTPEFEKMQRQACVDSRQWDDDYRQKIRTILTQIRGCHEHIQVGTPPEGVNISGSIPSGDVVVMETVVMSGLEKVQWLEENITKELCPEGFVVVEPNGSLLSHINAHCRAHGVPYIVTDEVCVGDTWTEVASGWVVQNNDGDFVAEPYNPWQYIGAFRDGVSYGNKHWKRKQSALSTFFHQWIGQPCNDPELSAFLGGVFCAWMVKATIGATVGEMRHAWSKKSNAILPLKLATNAFMGVEEWDGKTAFNVPANRRSYHRWMAETIIDWEGASHLLQYMETEYKTGWSTSYGGPKWGEGCAIGARVATLIHQLMQAGDDELEDVGKELIEAVNSLENAQHNTGGLLNKFGSDTMGFFDAGTSGFREGDMRSAFHTYMIAMDIVNDRVQTNAGECSIDWVAVSQFFTKQPKHWRENPVLQYTDAPADVQVVLDGWRSKSYPDGLHRSNTHKFNNTNSKSYVPSGHPNDSMDVAHYNWVEKQSAIGKPSLSHGNEVWLLGVKGVAEGHTATQDTLDMDVLNAEKSLNANLSVSISETIGVVDWCLEQIQKGLWEKVKHLATGVLMQMEPDNFVYVMEAVNNGLDFQEALLSDAEALLSDTEGASE